jgi:hypothetical protein
MTHEDLLDFIEHAIFESNPLGRVAWKKIKTIVELHEPWNGGSNFFNLCKGCKDEHRFYPCPIIEIIEKELK